MNEGMILLNPKGKLISINPAAKRLLDASEDCIGADMLSLSRDLGFRKFYQMPYKESRVKELFHCTEKAIRLTPIQSLSEMHVKEQHCSFNVTEKRKQNKYAVNLLSQMYLMS